MRISSGDTWGRHAGICGIGRDWGGGVIVRAGETQVQGEGRLGEAMVGSSVCLLELIQQDERLTYMDTHLVDQVKLVRRPEGGRRGRLDGVLRTGNRGKRRGW